MARCTTICFIHAVCGRNLAQPAHCAHINSDTTVPLTCMVSAEGHKLSKYDIYACNHVFNDLYKYLATVLTLHALAGAANNPRS